MNPDNRIRNEGEIFYENRKTMNLRFYFYFFYQDHFKIYQMYVTFKEAKKFRQNKFKVY